MTRVIYVNGRYLPYAEAGVHAEDRGFQFADAVYEVCEIRERCLVDERRHLARLSRSLNELEIPAPMSDRALGHIVRETVRRNRVTNGLVYLQVTRGQAPRDFPFPARGTEPTLVCIARALNPVKIQARADKGIAVVSAPDIRWGRCDLKTVMLLPACLAKETARRSGAQEAWFVDDDGFVTEGASSNAWIVLATGCVVTRPIDNHILSGVTRLTALDVLRAHALQIEERAFSLAEALGAVEAFNTSASATIMPVVSIDGRPIGRGQPGRVTRLLRAEFHKLAEISLT
jgi:D-alanine transaminase